MQFKERESQYSELGREYREKLEAVKFERERIALKEEQFLRQVQKNESQTKQEVKRTNDKLTSQMHARKREADKKFEDLEDRMYRVQEDLDTYKRQNETFDRENFELKK